MIRKVFITNIIFAAIFLPTYFAAPAAAETTQGLNVEVYTYDPSSLPNHSAEGYQLCANAWTSSTNIFHNFDAEFQGIVAGCQGDFVLVHYSGYMTFPETADIVFLSQADDGFFMQLDDQIVLDDWWLKGCSGNSFTRTFEANVSQKLDVWFYEYGGGACNQLYMQSELGWTQIPDSVFTKESITVEPLDPALVQAAADLELAKTRLNELLAAYPADTDWSKIPEVISLQDSLATIELAISNKDLAAVQLISSLNSSFDLASSAIEKFFTPVEPPIEPPIEPEPEPEPEPELPPVTPEPSPEPTIEPTPEPLPEPAIPTAEEAHAAEMQALMEAAQEDDLEVPSEIAALPVVGAVAEALISSINALGNVGADLTPEVREKAKKTIVSAIIVTQVAQLATGTALAASSSAAASSTSIRRK